ncbi:MAG: DUF2062 domain-containing protein [Planctomycetaceae bacterium]|nr:DUF2062 domain-containing protein [Planctomycetaceae bacterium]
MRLWWNWLRQSPRTILRQIVFINDTHHSKSLGAALGVFIAMTPTVGIQSLIVILVAAITYPFFYFNRTTAFASIYISNPITMVPIYWVNYKVGTWFVKGTMDRSEFAKILEYESFTEWWQTILQLFIKVGTPLMIGSFIVSTLCGVATYFLVRRLLCWLTPDVEISPHHST